MDSEKKRCYKKNHTGKFTHLINKLSLPILNHAYIGHGTMLRLEGKKNMNELGLLR